MESCAQRWRLAALTRFPLAGIDDDGEDDCCDDLESHSGGDRGNDRSAGAEAHHNFAFFHKSSHFATALTIIKTDKRCCCCCCCCSSGHPDSIRRSSRGSITPANGLLIGVTTSAPGLMIYSYQGIDAPGNDIASLPIAQMSDRTRRRRPPENASK